MLKIIATHPRYGRQLVDRTADRADAEYLQREYQLAFGREWTVAILPTQGHKSLERVRQLRDEGKTLPEIAVITGLRVSSVNVICRHLREHRLTDRRAAGKPHDPAVLDRNEQIAQLRESGVGPTEIARQMNLNFNTVRAIVHQLRRSGRLPRCN